MRGSSRPAARLPAQTHPRGRPSARYGLHVSKDRRAVFARYLARRMKERDINSPAELARALSAHQSVVGRWLKAETDITIDYIRTLAPVLDESPLELMIQAGYFQRHEIMDAARRLTNSAGQDERSAG